MIKGWELSKLIYLGEITDKTIIDVYIDKKKCDEFIYYENGGLRYLHDSKYFPRIIYKDKEVASSFLFGERFHYVIK
ncbi:TPA: hypothetical protein ACXDAY_002222 [Clostridium botulinum]|uniref:hypothetical protein n=1 Tax=Clostridium botulinum TaxID=1491 RepID=UPI000772FACB|nr:hypothetical protein [Clostridium botulinum]APH20998.1 hypothetical protein NPD1_4148 [Clostridium botulinum]APQ71163.1 hypothetical protein RSJ8_4105 [Clostridium botulinum]MBN3359213.1 hypothetical protein [Clostridium botulinum]MBN3379043.1 hypothetical protein [Clostridium botulinum]QDY27061.1 hypothetical protein CGQ40_20365 [Clostridium botulinum]